MSYVLKDDLDQTSDLTEARAFAGLTVPECIDLCNVSSRTWYRWARHGAPKWAIRLIMSCRGALDHFGWKDWEIRRGRLYFNQLSYRYYWDPVRLVVPLYGITNPEIIYQHIADNVSGIMDTRELKLLAEAIEDHASSPAALKSKCA